MIATVKKMRPNVRWLDRGEAVKIVALAAPMTGTALVNMGMSITDTVMMGWIGTVPLAAGAVVSDLYSIVFYFMSGILATVAAVLAQALGRDDADGARRAMANGFQAAVILAVPAFVMVWNLDLVLAVFGIDAEVVALGRDYATMMAFTAVAMLGVAVWRNVLSAFSRPRVFLILTALALPLNAVLNYVLMFGQFGAPEMGLMGAGLSSAMVAFAMLAGLTIYAARDRLIAAYHPFAQVWRLDRSGVMEVFRLGVPAGFTTLGNVGIYLLSTPIISLFGTEALAAHAITLRLAGVFYAVPVGLSQAATVRVGYAAGRGEEDAVETVKRTAVGMAAFAGAAMLVVLVGLSGVVPGWVLGGGETIAAQTLAGTLMILLGITNAAEYPNVVAGGVLRGMKDTRVPMLLTLTGYWAVGAPVMMLAAFVGDFGAQGVWFGLAVGVYVAAALMLMRVFRVTRPVGSVAAPLAAAAE